jgi:hypothetical protein
MIYFLVNGAYTPGCRIKFPCLKGFVTLNYNPKNKIKTLDIPWDRYGRSFFDRGANEPDAHGPKPPLSCMRHQTRTTLPMSVSLWQLRERPARTSLQNQTWHASHAFQVPIAHPHDFSKRGQSRRALSLSIQKVPGGWDRYFMGSSLRIYQSHVHRISSYILQTLCKFVLIHPIFFSNPRK